MTVKFTIRHHYKDIPIEITIEAGATADLGVQLNHMVEWLAEAQQLIEKYYKGIRKLTEKETHRMTRYKRKWNCAICNEPVIYDSSERTITCGCEVGRVCGVYPSQLTLKAHFLELKNE